MYHLCLIFVSIAFYYTDSLWLWLDHRFDSDPELILTCSRFDRSHNQVIVWTHRALIRTINDSQSRGGRPGYIDPFHFYPCLPIYPSTNS